MNICIELMNGKRIYAELYPDKAPKTVENFLKLVDSKFYDGTIFHRVISGFMSQGGGFYLENGTLYEKHTDSVYGEFAANGFNNPVKHELGVLSMARANDYNSASSQFFICDVNCSFLDGQYAAFGKIYNEFESLKNCVTLNNINTTKIANGFDNFPLSETDNYTIKTIYRVK